MYQTSYKYLHNEDKQTTFQTNYTSSDSYSNIYNDRSRSNGLVKDRQSMKRRFNRTKNTEETENSDRKKSLTRKTLKPNKTQQRSLLNVKQAFQRIPTEHRGFKHQQSKQLNKNRKSFPMRTQPIIMKSPCLQIDDNKTQKSFNSKSLKVIEQKDASCDSSVELKNSKVIIERKNKENIKIRDNNFQRSFSGSKERSVHSKSHERQNKTNLQSFMNTQIQLKQKHIEALKIMNLNLQTKISQTLSTSQTLDKQLKYKNQKITHLNNQLEVMHAKLNDLQIKQKALQCLNKDLQTKLCRCHNQLEIALKQLNIFYQRKVPKNVKQLQSFREAYLSEQVQKLKQIIKKDKSVQIEQMQRHIERLRSEICDKNYRIQANDIEYRIISQKLEQQQKYSRKFVSLRSENKNLKLSLKEVNEQYKILQKQNVMIKNEFKKLLESIKIGNLQNLGKNMKRVSSQASSIVLTYSTESRSNQSKI